jgi:hypothetical protein
MTSIPWDRNVSVRPPRSLHAEPVFEKAHISGLTPLRCVIVLGEPGAGKTFAMEGLKRLDAGPGLWVPLRDYASKEDIRDDLLGGPQVQAWMKGTSEFTLGLDGLDEALLETRTLDRLLIRLLHPPLPVARLRLRLSCRSAVWPQELEDDLRDLFGAENVRIAEILPLVEDDIRLASRNRLGEGSPAFLEALSAAGGWAAASHPDVLIPMLGTWAREQRLETRRVALYRWAIGEELRENNEHRESHGHSGMLTIAQRYLLATRIAAAVVLSNQAGLDRGRQPLGGSWFSKDELAFEGERDDSDQVEATAPNLQEVLETGLFSYMPGRIRFVIHRHAEMLAAEYLRLHQTDGETLRRLLTDPESGHAGIVPQLEQMATWVGDILPDGARLLVEADPRTALHAQVETWSEEVRAALVDSLLEGIAGSRISVDFSDLQTNLGGLDHASLAAQLRPWVEGPRSDDSARESARDVALCIAWATRRAELLDALLETAKRSDERPDLRHAALLAFVRTWTHHRPDAPPPVEAFVSLGAEADPLDHLRGVALEALWPKWWTTTELLPHIMHRPRNGWNGHFATFLWSMPHKATPADLPVFLEWAASPRGPLQGWGRPEIVGERVVDDLVRLSIDHLNHLDIQTALVSVLMVDAGDARHARMLQTPLQERPDIAAALIIALLRRSMNIRSALRLLPTPRTTLRPALLAAWDETPSTRLGEAIVDTLTTDWVSLAEISDILARPNLWEHIEPITRDLLHRWPGQPDRIADEIGQQRARDEEQLRQRLQAIAPPRTRTPVRAPVDVRVRARIDVLPNATWEWWNINLELWTRDEDEEYHVEWHHSTSNAPGWDRLDLELQQAVVGAAELFLTSQHPHTDEWLEGGEADGWAIAGVRALALLDEHARPIQSSTWEVWAPAVVAFSYIIGDGGLRQRLTAEATHAAPKTVAETWRRLLPHEQAKETRVIQSDLDRTWCPEVAETVLRFWQTLPVEHAWSSRLIDVLVRHQTGLDEISLLLPDLRSPEPSLRDRAVTAAASLLTYGPGPHDKTWAEIHGAGPDIGNLVFEKVASRSRPDGLPMAHMDVRDATLLLDLCGPTEPELQRRMTQGVVTWGSQGTTLVLRTMVLEALVLSGSPIAPEAIALLRQQHPDWPELRLAEHRARRAAGRAAWQPPSPRAQLRRIRESAHRRSLPPSLRDAYDLLVDLMVEGVDLKEVLPNPGVRESLFQANTHCTSLADRAEMITLEARRHGALPGLLRAIAARYPKHRDVADRLADRFAAPPGRVGPPWDVFISHARLDSLQADQLYDLLIQRGCRPFLAHREVPGDQAWIEVIEDALQRSSVCVVLVSHATRGSWQMSEYPRALELKRQKRTAVLIVALDNLPLTLRPLGLEWCNGLTPESDGGWSGIADKVAAELRAADPT